jgi:hypothetical protein
MMSLKVLEGNGLIIWFHSYDALHEKRTSVHAAKGPQDDHHDAKIWLEPKVEIARVGKTFRTREINKALKMIGQDLEYLLEEWHEYRNKTNS